MDRNMEITSGEARRVYENIDIANLLTGVITQGSEVRETLSRLGLESDGAFFCVAQFNISGGGVPTSGPPRFQAEAMEEFSRLAEERLMAALPGDSAVRVGIQAKSVAAIIRAVKEKSVFPGVPVDAGVLAAVDEVREELSRRFSVEVSAFVSNYAPGLTGPRAAYMQIEEAVYYMGIFEKTAPVTTFRSLTVDTHRSIEELVAMEERESRLLSAIQVNDFDSVLELINELIDEELVFGKLRLQEASCRLNSLLNNVLHILDRMWIIAGDGYFLKYNPSFRLLTGPRTIPAVRAEINHIFAEYAEYMSRNSMAGAETIPKWCVRLRGYIFDNFRDPDLNTAVATDYVGLNAAYAARVFRQHYGVSILEYINRLRIAEAKNLLSGGMRLIDVARASGYDNLPRMNRAFLRYEGTSPKENARQLQEK